MRKRSSRPPSNVLAASDDLGVSMEESPVTISQDDPRFSQFYEELFAYKGMSDIEVSDCTFTVSVKSVTAATAREDSQQTNYRYTVNKADMNVDGKTYPMTRRRASATNARQQGEAMKNEGLTRRGFLSLGAISAAALAGTGLAGCAQPKPASERVDKIETINCSGIVVDPSQVTETIKADIVVLGGGMSGLSAAFKLRKTATMFILLEAQSSPRRQRAGRRRHAWRRDEVAAGEGHRR